MLVLKYFNPLPSHEGRRRKLHGVVSVKTFQSAPLMRGETRDLVSILVFAAISIRSPHARGDNINLQKSVRIYVSLHNKTMIHRFSELYKPLFCGAEPDIRGAKPTGKP